MYEERKDLIFPLSFYPATLEFRYISNRIIKSYPLSVMEYIGKKGKMGSLGIIDCGNRTPKDTLLVDGK